MYDETYGGRIPCTEVKVGARLVRHKMENDVGLEHEQIVNYVFNLHTSEQTKEKLCANW